jgi:hypothetical protein
MNWVATIAVFLAIAAAQSEGAPAALARQAQLRRMQGRLQSVASHSAAFQDAQRKFQEIAENGRLRQPKPKTTVLTADEINAYLAEGGVALPDAVQRVHFSSLPRLVTAAARIDFDRLTAARRINNPFMAALFTGVHDVSVEARASGEGGIGFVHVESVTIDGIKVPRAAMQFLVDYYLRPKYGPDIGLDSRFPLPAHIDAVVVGNDQVTVTQR